MQEFLGRKHSSLGEGLRLREDGLCKLAHDWTWIVGNLPNFLTNGLADAMEEE
jgi:hypothetical protein